MDNLMTYATRAWRAGYNAYNDGRSRNANPYDVPQLVAAWLDGYKAAARDAQPAEE